MSVAAQPEGSPKPLLVLISAPSGAGKTTVCQQLLAARPSMTRAITCTTRPPRAGEEHGRDYYFFAPNDFERRVGANEFLEHATVYGYRYGTLAAEVAGKLAAGKDVLLNVDVQGAASFRERALAHADLAEALVSIFLVPPSMAVLQKRLRGRGTDSPEVIERRLAVAQHEIRHWQQFEYLVVSSTIPEDLRRVQAIVDAEKMRTRRAQPPDLSSPT